MIECEVQAEALNEAYEQYKEMSDEIGFLKIRIEQLERYICDAGVPIPNDLLLMWKICSAGKWLTLPAEWF